MAERERERETGTLQKTKQDLLDELKSRVDNKIIEENNYILLKKLIEKAETLEEAIAIQQLGTMWKKTGFSYDVRLEKMTDDIYYFKKDEKLSFTQPEAKQTHKLIIGDNYKALINLQQEYQGKIKMIYIDPPYGKDSMGQFAQTNYKNNITRDNLLAMLEPRLRLARNLLSDDGVIFCSIDDKNQAYVKILFDDVFGEGNCEVMIWDKITGNDNAGSGKMKITHRFRRDHEYIIVAYKNVSNVYFNKYLEIRETKNTYTNPDNDARGDWISCEICKSEEKSLVGGKNYFTFTCPNGKEITRQWHYSYEELQELMKDNRIYFGNGNIIPRLKKFVNEKQPTTPKSVLNAIASQTDGNDIIENIFLTKDLFDDVKPVALIQHLLKIASQKDSIILDFFAGSGTTGQAVLEQNKADGGNRQFILVQLDEEVEGIQKEFCEKNNLPLNLASITYERLKRVMTGEASDGSNFKWLEKNEKLGDNLLVCEVSHCANFDKNVFENIDETLYGLEKFEKPIDKINWVCDNFEGTQKVLENKDGKQENKQGFIEK